MNGIQPMPLSTETNFRVGNRSSSPEVIRLQITRALEMNIIVEPTASLLSADIDGHGEEPNQSMLASLAPMWKFTGSCLSAQNSQSGVQASPLRSCRPW